MPPKKKSTTDTKLNNLFTTGDSTSEEGFADEFVTDLIKQINKEAQRDTAHRLDADDSNVRIKRWISTSSKLLDYTISNRRNGGIPEGRIIEIFGKYSSGKSLMAFQLAKNCQKMGGLVFYFDIEHSVVPEYLGQLGISKKNFILIDDKYVMEEVFQDIENLVVKVRASNKTNRPPILIIVDSIAALVPLAEKEADYEQQTMGLQARTLSKALRKITPIISTESVTLVLLNQTRQKINSNPYAGGPAEDSTGGNALKFFCSVRLMMDGTQKIKEILPNKQEEIIGIRAIAKTEKNKVSPPNRRCDFQILFGRGVEEHEEIFDVLRLAGPRTIGDKKITVEGDGSWKKLVVESVTTGEILVEKSFHKPDFGKIMRDKEFSGYIEDLLEAVMVKTYDPITEEDTDTSTMESEF